MTATRVERDGLGLVNVPADKLRVRRRLLVIDDDPVTLECFRILFEKAEATAATHRDLKARPCWASSRSPSPYSSPPARSGLGLPPSRAPWRSGCSSRP